MSRSKTSYLVDINMWLALVYDRHAHHELVLHWFEPLDGRAAACCRIVQLAVLRLLTNPSVMQSRVKTKDSACQPAGHKQGMDAYLAAFAISAQFEIITFDLSFRSYRGVPVTILGAVQ